MRLYRERLWSAFGRLPVRVRDRAKRHRGSGLTDGPRARRCSEMSRSPAWRGSPRAHVRAGCVLIERCLGGEPSDRVGGRVREVEIDDLQ